jgi:hypothetical protein
MSYLTQTEIAEDWFMRNRVAAAAADEHVEGDPDLWSQEHRREWAGAPGWDAAWESAKVSHEDEPDYQPGHDESVITDEMILSQVQSMNP